MPDPHLPPHIEQTVRAVEQLHVEHRECASPVDRLLDGTKALISRPGFLGFLLASVLAWVLANATLPIRLRLDPPPFLYLSLALAFAAVCITVLVLSTQWRADRLAEHREKLILQLTFVSEQKSAKLIALVEELRRDLPHVPNRIDSEAQQMTEAVDATAVSQALRPEDPAPFPRPAASQE
ncbi:MAG: DUF1003 domain-containing protein [Alphaproteobacteria bacterium]|nr:DUF1003 domain-containing protein [Alphaproteobacteria bacterium]